MATFKISQTVNSPLANIRTAALGASAGATLDQKDIGKTLKLVAGDKYVPCSDGDPFDGVLVSMDSGGGTVNSGYNVGGVQLDQEMEATVVANQSGQVAVGDFLVAGTPLAIGTEGLAQVKKMTLPTDATTLAAAFGKPLWKVITILSGNGSAGDKILMGRL